MKLYGRMCASLAALLAALLPALLLQAADAQAQARAPRLNYEYSAVYPPPPVTGERRMEVVEFFYYGCPICYELEPALSAWIGNAPDTIVVRRVPALSSALWENFAKLFYTLEALGHLDRLHWPVYDNFHVDDIRLNEEPVMFDWVSRNGIDPQLFVDTYGSPAIAAKVVAARELLRSYGIKGVPTLVIDGRFITSAHMAGSTKQLIPVLNYLVEQAKLERARLGKPAQ
ncbi:MAG: thiol:disulfide interchange protein DsbA/DsbL [Betaproteobacteria bacterium]|nr:thiol:disulfide interchange protein DsbA/DsbL [Betaproteobacteria bacterium]